MIRSRTPCSFPLGKGKRREARRNLPGYEVFTPALTDILRNGIDIPKKNLGTRVRKPGNESEDGRIYVRAILFPKLPLGKVLSFYFTMSMKQKLYAFPRKTWERDWELESTEIELSGEISENN